MVPEEAGGEDGWRLGFSNEELYILSKILYSIAV